MPIATMNNLPLALRLPLHGHHWIEASAGTGKTFTLSLLVLRFLLERDLRLPEILVVTFTNAATRELKIKIRDDIAYALHLLTHQADTTEASLDKKQQLFYALLNSAVETSHREIVIQRLSAALHDYDRASIYSIHGFCSRVIQDHALLLGEMLHEDELLTHTASLNQTIAFAIWRELGIDPQWASALTRLWSSPSALAKQLEALQASEYLLPLPSDRDYSSLAADALLQTHQHLRDAITDTQAEAKTFIDHAIASGWMHKSHFSPRIANNSFMQLNAWYVQNDPFAIDDPDIHRLSLDYIKTKAGKDKDKIPALPLFVHLQAWLANREAWLDSLEHLKVRCLHRVQHLAQTKRAALLLARQQKTYDDLVNKVFAALNDASKKNALLALLRTAYPVAMVDEFQDTDSKQWHIFSSMYLSNVDKDISKTLILIGDPKQAIYGFRGGDVQAYLSAKNSVSARSDLVENFRARPSLIAAINHSFSAITANPFQEAAIAFSPATAGGKVQENDFLIEERPATALNIAVLPDHQHTEGKSAPMPKRIARDLAAQACAEKISGLLNLASQEKNSLRLESYAGAVKPEHIAVLVNTHSEGLIMQSALQQRGIAGVTSSQAIIFDTEEAEEICLLLEALVYYQDANRWRGALAGQLLGYSAQQLLSLDQNPELLEASQTLRTQSLERWQTQGVLSLLHSLSASAAPRFLMMADGERRLSNYLQLAELLQEVSGTLLGQRALYQWLCQQRLQQYETNDEHLLRLDSDQHRVKILTIHKSKGLEFPLVFMPFVSLHASPMKNSALQIMHYHNEKNQRVSHALFKQDKTSSDDSVMSKALAELQSEKTRLLYVAMTRAKHYLWLCCGHVKDAELSAFSTLFAIPKNISTQAEIRQHLQQLHFSPNQLQIELITDVTATSYWKNDVAQAPKWLVNTPSASIQKEWRIHSFSGLSEQLSHTLTPITSNALLISDIEKPFAGKAFGNALHQALENIEMLAWQTAIAIDDVPAEQLSIVNSALQRHGFNSDAPAATVFLAQLVRNTLQARLPENIRLCDIPESQRRNEMEFYFSLRPCNAAALWQLLQSQHIIEAAANDNSYKSLTGLMTGKIDLLYEHDGKYFVADYKSNRLSDYSAASCHAAMHQHHYYFQALIYTLALHRWCRFYLAERYDYASHVGGVRYLFCRGLNPDNSPDEENNGIVAFRFEESLITAVEALLHPATEELFA
jgi:exodeoxyribonuclease V beta subunit